MIFQLVGENARFVDGVSLGELEGSSARRRCRAGCARAARESALLHATGVGTLVAEGKEHKSSTELLHSGAGIFADLALGKAWKADLHGNLVIGALRAIQPSRSYLRKDYRKPRRNFASGDD